MYNIILVSIDNLRFDCVGYQENKKFLKKYGVLHLLKTPTLDQLSQRALNFTNTFSVSTYTTTSHASLLTGLYPQKHKVRGFMNIDKERLANNVMTLQEVFLENDYHTAMLSDVVMFFRELNIDRGFEKVFSINEEKLFKFVEERKNSKKGFFIFVHFFDIHFPYLYSSSEFKKNYNKDYYEALKTAYKGFGEKWPKDIKDAVKLWNIFWKKPGRSNIYNLLPWYIKGITKFDQGRFKNFLDNIFRLLPRNKTILVIFSDHGEGKCSPNEEYFSHAGGLYDSVLRVPLVITGPEIKTKNLVNELTSLVDVYPTLLDMTLDKKRALLPQYKLDGVSLLDKERLKKREYIYAEVGRSNNPEALHATTAEWILRERCIRTKNFKYILRGRPERLVEKDFYRLPNEEFLRELYRALFYRFEDDEGFKVHLRSLQDKKKEKRELVKEFLSGGEHQERKNFLYFDLELDEDEEIPLDPLITKDDRYPRYLREIIRREDRGQDKQPIGLLPYEDIFINS